MRRTMIILLLISSAVSIGAESSAVDSDKSIDLGVVKITIGESQQAVMARLSELYAVKNVTDGMWTVTSKSGPPYNVMATITFQDERLVYVTRPWGPNDQQKGVDFARVLYSAISKIEKSSNGQCLARTDQVREPSYDRETIVVNCGTRSIEVGIVRSENFGESATVTEILGK